MVNLEFLLMIFDNKVFRLILDLAIQYVLTSVYELVRINFSFESLHVNHPGAKVVQCNHPLSPKMQRYHVLKGSVKGLEFEYGTKTSHLDY